MFDSDGIESRRRAGGLFAAMRRCCSATAVLRLTHGRSSVP